jgi:hypothetical protein
MPFKPGISGNPSGRPRVTLADGRTLAEIARGHTELAIAALAEIASCGAESGSARVSAATALLDRGWGRPKQASGDDVCEYPNQIGSEQGRFLSTEETMRVVEFFFGKDRVEQALAEPTGYIEHH